MDYLPDELVLQILHYLDVQALKQTQCVSKKFLRLGTDTSIWKDRCYATSEQEITRRLIYEDDTRARSLFLAQWDTSYPGEDIDYYQEYINANADLNTSWLEVPNTSSSNRDERREITGIATLRSDLGHSHAVCPVDDGSILIYDLSAERQSTEIAGHSGPGLLTPGALSPIERQYWMTRGTSIEVVSVDSSRQRGFFAINDTLQEVDLNTLSLVSSKRYPSSISTLSTHDHDHPLLIGTSQTVHIYDDRDNRVLATDDHVALDQTSEHIILAQPSPSSILHIPGDTVVIGGRFTSLLEYSLRYFPRLVSTIHSGAHISDMVLSPHRLMADSLDALLHGDITIEEYIERKSLPSYTIVCAGAYKGKGSLEMYCRSSDNVDIGKFANRLTAAPSKMLSVALHGTRLVTSDGNGNIRWSARDGRTNIRTHRLVTKAARADTPMDDSRGLWGQNETASTDIVQKITTYADPTSCSGRRPEKLLLWTGEGRLGILGFGPLNTHQADQYFDAVETQAESAADRAKHDAERQFAKAMRRALERNADEVRFVRGLGMSDFTY